MYKVKLTADYLTHVYHFNSIEMAARFVEIALDNFTGEGVLEAIISRVKEEENE